MISLTVVAGLASAFLTGALIEGGGYVLVCLWLKRLGSPLARNPGWFWMTTPEEFTETKDLAVNFTLLGAKRLAKLIMCRWCTLLYTSFLAALLAAGGAGLGTFALVWGGSGMVAYIALKHASPVPAEAWSSKEPGNE